MPEPTTHITTSGGLISAAFIHNIRELETRQRETSPGAVSSGRSSYLLCT
jgi:hypothetical protein